MQLSTAMDLDGMIPDKRRSCSSKFYETPYFIFHLGLKGNLLEFKEFESRENSENRQENVYDQERELMETRKDET